MNISEIHELRVTKNDSGCFDQSYYSRAISGVVIIRDMQGCVFKATQSQLIQIYFKELFQLPTVGIYAWYETLFQNSTVLAQSIYLCNTVSTGYFIYVSFILPDLFIFTMAHNLMFMQDVVKKRHKENASSLYLSVCIYMRNTHES